MEGDQHAQIRRATSEMVAVAMHTNPGVYALLLGAGISQESGVPSAWGITEELSRKLAACYGDIDVKDGLGWYREKFNESPTYSTLFERLSTCGAERVGLLKGYFEASEDDIDLGLKSPTPAHRAIARMVAQGYVRVVVTTNFDRLLENALSELGIQPIVISTESDAELKPPFVHNKCTIFKVHGDYLDDTFRNTSDELSAYPPNIQSRLRQVFSEYGLLVCGWSGASDVALREALQEGARRYATLYWASRSGRLSEHAEQIVEARGGCVVSIESADAFFDDIAGSIEALEQMNEQETLTEDLARMRAQAYATDATKKAKFDDMVIGLAKRAANRMSEIFENGPNRTGYEAVDLLRLIERETSVLRTVVATGCFYDDDLHDSLWKRCVQTLFPRRNGYIAEEGVELYPALLVSYTIGIISRLRRSDRMIKTLLVDTVWQYYSELDVDLSIATLLYPSNVLDILLKGDPSYSRQATPAASYLFPYGKEASVERWKPVLHYAASDLEFKRAATSYEYLLGAQFLFERGLNRRWAPPGSLWLRRRTHELPKVAIETRENVRQLHERGEVWGPVAEGMFEGSMEVCISVLDAYNAVLEEQRRIFL